MTATTETKTLTVLAPKIERGDVIGGRVVRAVTGRRPRTVNNAESSHSGTGDRHKMLEAMTTFKAHVVCVGFDDGGPWKYYFGDAEVEVERPAAQPDELVPPRAGVSVIRHAGDPLGVAAPSRGWRWVAFTPGGVQRGEEPTRERARNAALRAAA